MSVQDVHYLHGIKLQSGPFISQLTDLTPANNHTILAAFGAGHPQPLFRTIMSAKPDIQFTTPQLGTILTACGLFGLNMSLGPNDLYYKQGQNLGSRISAAGASHKRVRMVTGLMYWQSIRAQFQQLVTAQVRIKPIYDGTNIPFVPAGAVTLPDPPSAAEEYILAKLLVNGVSVGGKTELEINPNCKLDELGADDDVYDTYAGIAEHSDPKIMIKGLTWANWLSYGLAGAAITTWEVYFRRKAQDAESVPLATATHIKIAGTNGIAVVESTTGGANTPSSTGVALHLRAPAYNADWATITVGSAIP